LRENFVALQLTINLYIKVKQNCCFQNKRAKEKENCRPKKAANE